MNSKKNLKRNLLICLLAGSAVMYTLPLHAATSVIGNNTLPQNGQFVGGSAAGSIVPKGDLQLDVSQKYQNAVIKWDSFDVGGSATVNFSAEGAYANNFNTLNYINSGAASQIYGTINAQGGNIFIVNPAGVQIGNSAQINVGSLHVSNKNLDDAINKLFDDASKDETGNFYQTIGLPSELMANSTNTDAVLMSLGNINANKVTFEGDGRIVIDSERIKNAAGSAVNNDFEVHTNDDGNVLIGYDAYNEIVSEDNGTVHDKGTYEGKKKTFDNNVFVNNSATATVVDGYMWVEDVNQLQAIYTNLEGNYALRNSIDATSTEQNDFTSIGSVNDAFKGKFDGIDYNIFGLTIKNGGKNTGLFGYTNNATISNVTLVGGSITGSNNVGAIVGNANNTTLTNVVNSAAVSGDSNVGGIVGSANNSAIKDAINTGTINGSDYNVGGLIGNLQNSKLDTTKEVEKGLIGNSYNLGDVSGNGHNVGGLVGSASNSTIGDDTNLVYNRMDVTGAYNVGGIVGNMQGTTVQNAENSGNVTATRYTTETYYYHAGQKNNNTINAIVKNETVNVANVGGIAGKADNTDTKESIIKDVINTGNVSSNKGEKNNYYDAGNVGGIVGSAVDTNISNATNKENEVRGAHNVGGVAGYFGNSSDDKDAPDYTITKGINDGGDIMATGARNADNFVTEKIRPEDKGNEETIIGNMGGVVGYLDGDNVHVTSSGNRGTVHSLDITGDTISEASQASNTGGVVGKIDRSDTLTLANLQGKDNDGNDKILNAAVSNSYNTGDVRGYMGVGGVVGMMYNGEVAGSYNLGAVNTTRRAQDIANAKYPSVNMGGVVGDTTEETTAEALIYDVYNKGQIGDETYQFYARHVGGVVGRLSGTVEKAYNTGAIYNGYNVVGGIAGWFYKGTINNSFNTGNITVVNNDITDGGSQVGGIAGGVGLYSGSMDSTISNSYNLGTLRSFTSENGKPNYIGGIIGRITSDGSNKLTIKNVYTTGNLYAQVGDKSSVEGLSSIYGNSQGVAADRITVENAYYIRPDEKLSDNKIFTDLSTAGKDNSNKAIYFNQKSDITQYQYGEGANHHSLTFTQQADGDVDGGGSVSIDENGEKVALAEGATGDWRIYDGNTPILNAFLPDSEKYFAQNGLTDNSGENNAEMSFTGTIQYGTAYDPLLTIINTDRDLAFNFGTGKNELNITNAAGIAVYGGGLTFNNFDTSIGTGYFGGTIYADGALNISGSNDIGLGSAAQIYGSAVNITTDGQLTIYGDVTATGNIDNGAKGNESLPDAPDTITVTDAGHISINAGDVDVYGTLTSATNGEVVNIPGIEDEAVTWTPGEVDNPYAAMSDIADRFAHQVKSSATGDININAGTKLVVDEDGTPILDENDNKQYIEIGNGNVNLYFGNKEEGLITTGGDLTVTGTGDVYVDSDLDIKGNMTLTSTGKDSEVLLTLTNIGKVQANRFAGVIESAINGIDITTGNRNDLLEAIQNTVAAEYPGLTFDEKEAQNIVNYLLNCVETNNQSKIEAINNLSSEISKEYMHDFMHDFMHSFNENSATQIDLNAASGDAKLTVDMWVENPDGSGKYDFKKYDSNFTGTGHDFKTELNNLGFYINGKDVDASKAVYVEVSSGEQLKAIQNADSDALGYNYALMGDINASDVENYVAIGTNSQNGFTGTFDGRGNRIIGLTVSGENAGIFSTVGEGGVVKDVNIYSGTFTGTTTAGAVAGENNGRIEGIVTFGNTVTSNGNAGGIVGVNNNGGAVYDVESTGSVIAGSSSAVAGGLVGKNNGGLANSFSDSAVTVATGVTLDKDTTALGGVVGINNGNVQYVDSLGVTNGGATSSSNIGGIIGTNNGNMYSGYNESIVSGKDKVGGIIGENSTGGTVTNIVNATSVTGENVSADNVSQYVGGLVGSNSGSVTNGRNNGTITGTNYVGGMVGSNAQGATLTNLVNDSSAAIEGENYVGGIAGTNAGTITAQNQSNLINRGSITGQNYVGGVAGENIGTIEYVKNDVNLYVKDDTKTAQYFGGVAGINGRVDDETTTDVNEAVTGTITSATNEGDVVAENAQYVGGIVGWNTSQGKLVGMGNSNEGTVIGGSYVGGVIGKNDAAIGSKGSAQVGITNEGTVIATKGGAGGLIGENNAAITNTVMINRGEVHGNNTNDGSGTGGLIGTNNENGDITYSSLINEVTGTVTGTNNVGGLIGVNKADITGGRYTVAGEDAGMYINKIYNNGVINVGTYKDEDGDGKYVFYEQAGSNIGGLIGDNQGGSLTAGYNTGAINAKNSSNVGGIAGSNSGIIDQVFNTIMVADGALDLNGNKQSVAVTGGTNVGGLVGDNTGTITNAYNTSNVVATNKDGIVGNLVGTNTGEVKFVYGVANNLIGSGTDAVNGYVIDTSDQWKQEGSYAGFTFRANGWKIYNGYSNPMLSVFLTKVTVVDQHLVNQYFSAKHYGELHQITADDIKALIAIGAISAPDGFGAFNNNNGLIQGVADDAMANSGNWLYSQQILGSNINGLFNPNNLGYDISLVYSPFELDNDPSSHWNYLFNDAPFDRNKDFRERKAEVNFVDGGMEI